MTEDQELLTVSDPDEVTSEYNRLYAIYASLFGDSSPVDDLTSILTVDNEDATVAKYKAWDLFNIRGRQRSSTNVYAIPNYFEDDTERKAKELLLNNLNRYLRRLEGVRSGYNKLATMYSYLMYSGLYGILADIYVPENMRPIINGIIDSVNNYMDELIVGVQEYFKSKNNPKLNSIIISLGRIVLSQRSDQVFRTLEKYEPSLTEDDLNFLRESREDYLKFQNNPQLSYAKNAFGLADTTYYRNLNQIITDLSTILDEDSLELLTDLFLRN